MRLTLLIALSSVLAATAFAEPSPYAGQEIRSIKAMSDQEVSDYLAGKGMGLAKAAELNGYPGPAHVLENAKALSLTPGQETSTRTLFGQMQKKAVSLGKQLIEAEQRLDGLFATATVTPDSLSAALAAIGELQAKIRLTHLETHLTQASILTPGQVALYYRLRGYAGDVADTHHHHSR